MFDRARGLRNNMLAQDWKTVKSWKRNRPTGLAWQTERIFKSQVGRIAELDCTRYPSGTTFSLFVLGVSLLKLNVRKNGTLINRGLLDNLVYIRHVRNI